MHPPTSRADPRLKFCVGHLSGRFATEDSDRTENGAGQATHHRRVVDFDLEEVLVKDSIA